MTLFAFIFTSGKFQLELLRDIFLPLSCSSICKSSLISSMVSYAAFCTGCMKYSLVRKSFMPCWFLDYLQFGPLFESAADCCWLKLTVSSLSRYFMNNCSILLRRNLIFRVSKYIRYILLCPTFLLGNYEQFLGSQLLSFTGWGSRIAIVCFIHKTAAVNDWIFDCCWGCASLFPVCGWFEWPTIPNIRSGCILHKSSRCCSASLWLRNCVWLQSVGFKPDSYTPVAALQGEIGASSV